MHKKLYLSLLAVAVLISQNAQATVSLPKIYGDNMVLQRDMPVCIRGFGSANEAVSVSFSSPNNALQTKNTITDSEGHWKLYLNALNTDNATGTLSIHGASNNVSFTNILVGEVWLFTGQSNMQFRIGNYEDNASVVPTAMRTYVETLSRTENPYHAAIDRANTSNTRPLIRLFSVDNNSYALEPQYDVTVGSWVENTPENIRNVSAVGYFACEILADELSDVPIGMVGVHRGASHIQTYIQHKYTMTDAGASAVAWYSEKQQEGWNRESAKCFNANIQGIAPYTMRGTAWLQGESTNGRWDYFQQHPLLVQGWRDLWGQDKFHFAIIATFTPPGFNAGMANTASIFDDCNYLDVFNIKESEHDTNTHYWSKHPVGQRTAWWMLNTVYGDTSFPAQGPQYASHSINQAGDTITVTFDHVGTGLATSDGGAPGTFLVSTGASWPSFRKATSATIINGNQVELKCSNTTAPLTGVKYRALRHSHNLVSSHGWSACEFETFATYNNYGAHLNYDTWQVDKVTDLVRSEILWPANGAALASGSPVKVQGASGLVEGRRYATMELFVDGQLVGDMNHKYNHYFELDTGILADGYHTLKTKTTMNPSGETDESDDTLIYVGDDSPEYYELAVAGADRTNHFMRGMNVSLFPLKHDGIHDNLTFTQWVGDTSSIADASSERVTMVMPEEDAVINAIYTGTSNRTVATSAGNNGSISPSGSFTMAGGTDLVLAIRPDAGYKVDDVLLDGVSIGAVNKYRLNGVSADHTITCTFVLDSSLPRHTITASAGSGGVISPGGALTVLEGNDQSFTISPYIGYEIDELVVDDQSVTVANPYSFQSVSADHTISCTFSSLPAYTITATAGSNGSISPNGATAVYEGGTQTVRMIPDAGYRVEDVTVNGQSAGAVYEYAFNNVQGNNTISCSFIAGLSGLLLHYTFDETSGSTAADSSGNGHDATATGTPTWITAGRFGGAWKGGGLTKFSAPMAAFAHIDSEITISFWMKSVGNPITSKFVIFGAQNATGGNVFSALFPWNGMIDFTMGHDGTNHDRYRKTGVTDVDFPDAWLHWAVTKNTVTGEIKVYRAGVLYGTQNGQFRSMSGVATPFDIGAAGTSYFSGAMDDFRVYSKALSADDVAGIAARRRDPTLGR